MQNFWEDQSDVEAMQPGTLHKLHSWSLWQRLWCGHRRTRVLLFIAVSESFLVKSHHINSYIVPSANWVSLCCAPPIPTTVNSTWWYLLLYSTVFWKDVFHGCCWLVEPRSHACSLGARYAGKTNTWLHVGEVWTGKVGSFSNMGGILKIWPQNRTNHYTCPRKGPCLTSGYLVVLIQWLPFLAVRLFPNWEWFEWKQEGPLAWCHIGHSLPFVKQLSSYLPSPTCPWLPHQYQHHHFPAWRQRADLKSKDQASDDQRG